jgi:hypothetical protein
MTEKFNYLSETKGTLLSILLEGIVLFLMSKLPEISEAQRSYFLFFALIGSCAIVILSTEVIREFKNSVVSLFFFLLTVVQFIIFFAFQYWYLLRILPSSFTGFSGTPVNFLYHSTMIFLFNPLIVPHGNTAEILVLINTFGSIILILFILQNIWQFRTADQTQ